MEFTKFIITGIICIGIVIAVIWILLKSKNRQNKSFYLSIIAIVLSIVPFVYTFIDSFPTKPLEILNITPVYVYRESPIIRQIKQKNPKADIVVPDEIGCYVVVEVKNGNRNSYISAFDISGKLLLSKEEFIFSDIGVGKSFKEAEKEYTEKKPYYQILWNTWPYRNTFPIKIDANSQQRIIFTLWEPIINGQREDGWRVPIVDYIGYLNDTTKPKRLNAFPSAKDLFIVQNGRIEAMQPNFIKSKMFFNLTVNGSVVPSDVSHIKEFVGVRYDDWCNQPLEKNLLRYDKEIQKP